MEALTANTKIVVSKENKLYSNRVGYVEDYCDDGKLVIVRVQEKPDIFKGCTMFAVPVDQVKPYVSGST